MRKMMGLSFVSSCALVMSLSLSDVTFASAPACTGYAVQHPDADCFRSNLCAMTNICTVAKRWEVSDFITTAGDHTVSVTGFRPNGGSLSCQSSSITREGFAFSSTPLVAFNVVDVDTTITLGTVTVPALGGLAVGCNLSPGARYDSANF